MGFLTQNPLIYNEYYDINTLQFFPYGVLNDPGSGDVTFYNNFFGSRKYNMCVFLGIEGSDFFSLKRLPDFLIALVICSGSGDLSFLYHLQFVQINPSFVLPRMSSLRIKFLFMGFWEA